jgi:hypothetical protein
MPCKWQHTAYPHSHTLMATTTPDDVASPSFNPVICKDNSRPPPHSPTPTSKCLMSVSSRHDSDPNVCPLATVSIKYASWSDHDILSPHGQPELLRIREECRSVPFHLAGRDAVQSQLANFRKKNRIPREQSPAGWNLQYRQTNTLRKDGTQLSYLRCQPSQRRRACRMELIICECNSLKINKINVLTTISPSGYFSTYLISWLHYRTECATVTCCCRTGRQNPCCIT